MRQTKPASPHDKAYDMEATQDLDLLYGVPAIALALRLSARQARHLADKRTIPTFKIGKIVCARRSTLNLWLAKQEAKARDGVPPVPETRPAPGSEPVSGKIKKLKLHQRFAQA